MTTTKTRDPLRGYRILRGSINIGDYIRIANQNPSMSGQWWKVTNVSHPSTARITGSRTSATVVDLVNAEGSARACVLNAWDKIVRHPHSQKLADPANYLPLED